MRRSALFVLAMATLAQSWTLSLQTPLASATMHQKDTVYINYSADSAFMADRQKVVFEISINGSYFVQLHPANIADLGINAIITTDPSWGHVPFVIPDSVKFSRSLPVVWRSTISDSIKFRVKDYSIDSVNGQSGFVKIIAPTDVRNWSMVKINSENKLSVKLNNGVLESSKPMVSIKAFSLAGKFIGVVPGNNKMAIAIPGKYQTSNVRILQIAFADNIKYSVLLVNTH